MIEDGFKKTDVVGPTKGWSKVVSPITKKKSLKRKEISSSDSDVDADVQDISLVKKVIKKIPVNVPDAPTDNLYFFIL